jgi:hypothetical protein
MSTAPLPPEGLGVAGRALWESVIPAFVLEPDELALLASAARTVDELDRLTSALAKAKSLTVRGSTGQERAHPLLAEVRHHRLVLAKLLDEMGLPEAPGRVSAASRRASRAAESRWAPVIEARGRRGASG